jgi:hypothetical protein
VTTIYADPVELFARLLRRTVRTESGCWHFTGTTNSRGYSCVGSGKRGKSILGHRLAVLARDGQIPDGMTVDHQCHDSQTCRDDADCPHRRCVNPDHLRVMSNADNTGRVWEAGTCRKGHPLTPRKDGKRQCVTCRREYANNRKLRIARDARSKRMAEIVAKRTP